MTKPNFSEIVCIVDRSGSMRSIRDDAIGGFNAFLEDQKKEPGEAVMTYVQFDHEYDKVFEAKNLQEVEPLTNETFVPRGMTALQDAIGMTIVQVGERLAAMPEDERPENVIVVILTDGRENASQEYRDLPGLEQVQRLIKEQEEKWNWHFIFLSSDLSAAKTGESLGFACHSVAQVAASGGGIQCAYDAASRSVGGARKGFRRMDTQSLYDQAEQDKQQ